MKCNPTAGGLGKGKRGSEEEQRKAEDKKRRREEEKKKLPFNLCESA